ncbi:MAG: class I SAM-dependent methyltransferase [Solobacterium sp.]|nr:class I SAM-dependent methyltransferase [Solobacterium sp.]
MEGSNKEVKEYEYLAKYYDYLLGDEEAFNFWLEYINAKDYHTVLELASGSGVLAGILKKQGKEVTASDISKEMKEVATNNFDGEYLILNMIDFDLHKKYDLILCVCDSINYLHDEELEQMFKSVYKHLNDGGRFIFDMHNPKRLKEFDEEYIEEGQIDENVYYQWTINSDTFDRTVNEHFTFYTPEGMIQEQHTQNVFEVDDVKNKLENVGLESEVVMDFIEDEKILFIGTK